MNLNLSEKRQPKVAFPSEMLDKHYTGKLMGYYVENTNFYNVMPIEIGIERKKCSEIGEIFLSAQDVPHWDELYRQVSWRFHQEQEKGEANAIDKIREAMRVKSSSASVTSNHIWEGTPLIGYWEKNELIFVSTLDLTECEQELYSLKLDVFSRNTGILESDIMMSKKALFIGCGSVGSLAALELAKAGVGHFMLVDNDVFGYHNICRHQCGIYDVGRFKTEAVKDRIQQINPYANVIVRNMTIQEVPLADLTAFCNPETIVIGGADNRAGDLYANGIAKQVGMPFMSIGCWERAFAGEIFYCLPEGMPDYQDFMEATGNMSGRVTQNRRFYTTEADLERVSFEPGISVDINFVTVVAVKLALDLLNRNNEHYTKRLLPHLTQYTLVCNTNNTTIGGDMAEIFSYPLQVTTSIKVPYSSHREQGA